MVLGCGIVCLRGAFPPTKHAVSPPLTGQKQLIGNLYLMFAALLFVSLAIICFRVFTKPDFAKGEYDISGSRKVKRNRPDSSCGIAILAGIGLVGVFNLLLKGTSIPGIPPVFLFEFTALVVSD